MKLKKLCLTLLISIITIFTFNFKVNASIPSNISIRTSPQAVHIDNTIALKEFINNNQFTNATSVTNSAKGLYFKTYNLQIDISNTSMSVEILGHIYPDEFAEYLPKSLKDKIKTHTQVIDSGEKSVDSDRWVWDSIAAVIDYFRNEPQLYKKGLSNSSEETIINKIHQRNPNKYLDDRIMKKVILNENQQFMLNNPY